MAETPADTQAKMQGKTGANTTDACEDSGSTAGRSMKPCPLNLSPTELTAYTPEWDGPRLPDGRPKVPDALLERMRHVTITQAWVVMRGQGYHWQYEGEWVCSDPGGVLVGQALTAMYMPRRPDLRQYMDRLGENAGCGSDQIHWPIDALSSGDVYVADVFGKIEQGAIMGDNLAAAVQANSGNGVVHDAAVRDWDGIRALPNFTCFARGAHPSFASPTIMLAGMNCPVRIGQATVMPGDVVLGRGDGVIFIPPHLVERVVDTSELLRLRDRFGKQRLRERRYTPGEIDCEWTGPMERDFLQWVEDQGDQLPVTKERMEELLAERTW